MPLLCCGSGTTVMSSSRRPSSARPTASSRRSSAASEHKSSSLDIKSKAKEAIQDSGEFTYECKAGFLTVAEDITSSLDSRKQLLEALQQTGRNLSSKKLDKLWESNKGNISFDQFVDICRDIKPTTEDDLMAAFKKIDRNSDGFISNNELFKVMCNKGEKMTKDEVQKIIDEVDEDGNGKLDYKEFCNMMLNTQEEAKKVAKRRMEKKEKRKAAKPDASPGSARKSKKNESMGSQLSLKASTSAKPTKQDPMGSQVSIKSNASARSKDSKDERVTAEETAEVKNAADEDDSPAAAKNGATDSDKDEDTQERDKEEDEDSDDDDIVVGSKVSLQKKSSKNEKSPSPNNKERKERSKSPVITPDKKLKLSEPKKLKDWNYGHYKGCFFVEEKDQIVSHYYSLVIPEDTSVWITIQSFGLRPGADLTCLREGLPPLDTMLFLLRDQPDKDGNVLVTFTRHRDSKGKYGLRCDLPKGKYKLIPFTTGCRFQSRKSEPKIETKLVKKDKEGKFVLTKAFKEVLLDVFEVCDLDGNGTLSREEFSLYNVRTSGEEVADEEWDVVEENVELRKNELTHKGFLDLNQLEAEDNQGDTEDFWVTLQSMGYNKGLIMDEACPYKIEVYTEDCEADLKVVGLTSDNRYMESVLAQAVIRQGDGTKVKNAKDLFLHVFSNNFWACLVLYNKSYSDVTVEVDCSSSENVSTNRRNFKQISKVPAKSAIISQHLLPEDESKNWTIRWMEQIIK